jgi:hypothetical protein
MVDKPKNLTIFGMRGNVINETKLNVDDVSFDLSFLQKGVYLVKLNCNQESYYKKIVINYN